MLEGANEEKFEHGGLIRELLRERFQREVNRLQFGSITVHH
jgi:hypothetical protein